MERNLIQAVDSSIQKLQETNDKRIVTKYFYPYISDSSFMTISDDLRELVSLEKNMPAWGVKYTYPIDKILKVNVPVVNIGTFGKDGHKITERVHMKYTFETIPNITLNSIINLLR